MAKQSKVNIVMAANAMIENVKKITDVADMNTKDSFVFLYDDKFVWGIRAFANNEYVLTVYPGYRNINDLLRDFKSSSFQSGATFEKEAIQSVEYSSRKINTKEGYDTFSELYHIIREKRYNVDQILEEIITGSEFGYQE